MKTLEAIHDDSLYECHGTGWFHAESIQSWKQEGIQRSNCYFCQEKEALNYFQAFTKQSLFQFYKGEISFVQRENYYHIDKCNFTAF